jgi:hypothetical protein
LRQSKGLGLQKSNITQAGLLKYLHKAQFFTILMKAVL